MEKVKVGDTIPIDGVPYVFDNSSVEATNLWLDALARGIPEGNTKIHLYTEDRESGGSFPPSKIREAMKRAEREDWNKTAHGL